MSYELQHVAVKRAFNGAASTYDAQAVLQREVNERLLDTLSYVSIDPRLCLDLGSGTGNGASAIKKKFKRSKVIQTDLAFSMLKNAQRKFRRLFSGQRFVCGNVYALPFNDNTFDMVYSNLMLQWCSGLDAAFAEVSRVLKPGGVIVFSSFGPDTLKELRQSWQNVDDFTHINTFIDMHDVGDAMIRSGLQEPVLSTEQLTLLYDDVLQLMRELKCIGAQNVYTKRRKTLTGKSRLSKVVQHYETLRINDKLPASYEVIYGHAWKMEKIRNTDSQTISIDELRKEIRSRGYKRT